ncbi:Acyl-CoA-binding domain-containing protein 5, partial [Gryganskiella cystojenkinii]
MFYLPGGYHSGSVGVNDTMMAYNIALGTTSSLPMPSDVPSYIESTAAWSAYTKRLFLHGGRSSPSSFVPIGGLYSFNPADNTWIKPTAGGDTPPSRFNHCMASDATGKRLVVFGGFSGNQVALSDIYVLDVTTMQWKKGPDAGNPVARGAPSCGIDHDFFIVWGGGVTGVGLTNNITLLFNLQTMQWVSQFIPAVPLVTPSSGGTPGGGSTPSGSNTPVGGSTSGKTSTSSNGAIIGGAI